MFHEALVGILICFKKGSLKERRSYHFPYLQGFLKGTVGNGKSGGNNDTGERSQQFLIFYFISALGEVASKRHLEGFFN